MEYQKFIRSKAKTDIDTGMPCPIWVSPSAFDFQHDIISWALRRGRAAVFAQTGLGKTLMECCWGWNVQATLGRPVLILAPLSVAHQIVREAAKFGIPAHFCDDGACVRADSINVTNYSKLHKFDPSVFGGVVLDESSVLKSFDGKTRRRLIESFDRTPYRLAATATPAPNDFMELGNHSEFLGVMSLTGMQATFFTHDGGDTSKWRLKGHAEDRFWEWMCSWAVLIRKPSDLGYSDDAYALPPLNEIHHTVEFDGALAVTLSQRLRARRDSLSVRTEYAARLTPHDRPFVWWCNLNDESTELAARIPGAVEVRGSDADSAKEQKLNAFSKGDIRVLITKPSICGFGMNWQHCADSGFVGLSDSFEQTFQAVRRFWRFGQTRQVNIHYVSAVTEGNVRANLARKEADAARMGEAMVARMGEISKRAVCGNEMNHDNYNPTIDMVLPEWINHEMY